MVSRPTISQQIGWEKVETVTGFFWAAKSLWTVTTDMK